MEAERPVGGWWARADNVPANAGDFLDYSGLATPGEMTVPPWVFPLGRYVLPKSGILHGEWRAEQEIGISDAVANRHSVVYAPTQSGKTDLGHCPLDLLSPRTGLPRSGARSQGQRGSAKQSSDLRIRP